MPPRGSKLQKQKSTSDQQLNNEDQSHLSESNQKSDNENQPTIKQPEGTDSDDAQQIAAIEIQKQQDALMMISQPNFIITNNDQEEKSKDFLDAKSKVQNINIDNLVKIITKREFTKTQERILQNLHKFQSNFDENDATQILNILYFLKECLPFFKLCSFLTEEKRLSFCNEIQKLLNYNENEEFFQNYFLNVSSFCSDFDNLFRYQYNCKYFGNEFRKSFSKLTTSLSNSVQQISSKDENSEFSIEYQNLNESLTVLYINFKILMKNQQIRSAISFVDKLIKSKSDFHQFLCITDLITDESLAETIDQFDILIKLTLHLKMIFIIHQLIEILDQISSKINNKKRPPLENNEIMEYIEIPQDSSSTMYKILDEFNFVIKDKTDFLALSNGFIHQLNKDMEIDDFKSLLNELLSRSYSLLNKNFHQCGLNPVFFSLHYHYRMIQAATSSIIPLIKNDTFDQNEYLQKYYISLKRLLKKFSSLESKNIDIGIINDLYFSLIMQIKDPCHDVKPKSSYKGTSAFQNVYKYIKLCQKDLKIIENTICFTHQVDFFLKELKVIDDESCFNLNCKFYFPSNKNYFKAYHNIQIHDDQNSQTDNYDPIIREISFQLHSHGYDMIPENYSQHSFCDISAPNISKAILIMLNYGDIIQIQKLIESPDQLGNEENLFAIINDIYKKVIENPQSKLHLKESISVYLNTYFLLRALGLAGKINFSNAVHLMYFRTFASIIFNDEFVGKVSLVTPFNPSTHPYYHSILKRLTNLKTMKQINDEISHIRLFYFKFAGAVFQLDPSILKSNLEIFTQIFEWFSNPSKESNDRFLSCKYLIPVKELKNYITEIIKNTKQTLSNQSSIYIALREVETILKSISNIQIHYIQFRKTELIIPYLRSFFSCKEEDQKFCQFISYYPVWLNSIHRCLNYGLIQCDESCLENAFKSTPTNVIENSERLIFSFNIQYLSFFNDLITCSLKAYNQGISMIIDVIVRGSFSFDNMSKLFGYVLKYFVSVSNSELSRPRYQLFMSSINYDLWRNIMKLSCLLIALNMHPYLRRKLNMNLLRIMNMKNYVNSYINGLLYLHSSVLSSSFDKESSRKLLLSIKEMQKLVYDVPIVVKISETYFQISRIIVLIMSANHYLCEVGPEEGIIGRIESFIRNIQDKKIHDAFESSFRVALLSGTNSQGATILLSKMPNGAPVSAAQSAAANGYESIFYNKHDENYLDDLTDVLNDYLDIDDELRAFIQKNTDNYANSNYFNEGEDINVNIISCPLHKSLINECFNDDERRVENYVKAIDMINILSLYLSIIKETNSFKNFASLNLVSSVRLSPPFAIFKPPDWDKSDTTKSLISANFGINEQNEKQQQQQHEEEEEQTMVDSDWMKNNFDLFNSCIDDHFEFDYNSKVYLITDFSTKIKVDEKINTNKSSSQNQSHLSIQAKSQAQLQILPFQYAFSDTGISSTKFRFKNLYNTAQQALKTEIPIPKPLDEFDGDQLLPQNYQQTLVEKIDYIRKGINPDYLEVLKKQSLDEQRELRAKNNNTNNGNINTSNSANEIVTKNIFSRISAEKDQQIQQKDPLLLPKVIIKGKERIIKKSDKISGESDNEEEDITTTNTTKEGQIEFTQDDQIQNQQQQLEIPADFGKYRGADEEDENELLADEYVPPETPEAEEEKVVEQVKTRGRGRPPRKKDKKPSRGGKTSTSERTVSSSGGGLTPIQSSSSAGLNAPPIFLTQADPAPATGTLSFLKRRMIKLNQLEIDEAKLREHKESYSRVHPLASNTISQMGNEIKYLSKTSTENVEKKSEYYEALMVYNTESNNYLIKKEQLKQSQNSSRGLTLSNSIAQKVIDSHNNEKTKSDEQTRKNKENEEKIKIGYSLFNPFNLFPSQKTTTKIDHEKSPPPEIEQQKQIETKTEQEEKEEDLSPSDLLLLLRKQVDTISQSKIKKNQPKNQEEENGLDQSNLSLSSNDQDNSSLLQQQEKIDQNEEIEEKINPEQEQIDLSSSSSSSLIHNQQSKQSLLSFEERLNNTEIPPELQFYDQEAPNYVSLSEPLQKLTRSCWACLSKEEIESNSLNNDYQQNSDNFVNNENTEELVENEKKNDKFTDLSKKKDFIQLHQSPSELQQRCNLYKRRIQSYKNLANDYYNRNDDDKSKSSSSSLSSSSSRKLSRTSSERNKNDFRDKNKTNDGNDGQVLSDADADMEGDSDVGFGLESDF